MTAPTDNADPVERAGRIIAAHAQPYTEWDELTEKWQEKSRECARAVLDDLAVTQERIARQRRARVADRRHAERHMIDPDILRDRR